MPKTLYVSDLDGTLLHSDRKVSEYSYTTLNKYMEEGLLFTFATARSIHSAKKVSAGLNTPYPLIVYNGTLVMKEDETILFKQEFQKEEIHSILETMLSNHIYPIVYSFIKNTEKLSYVSDKVNDGMNAYLNSRKGDKRLRPVSTSNELFMGDIFYVCAMGEKEELEPLYNLYKDTYPCMFQQDVYFKNWWLEIMPKNTSKANAISKVKEYLGAEEVVVFGDGINDIDMFKHADKAYAMENAIPALKEIATEILASNNEDGVVKFIEKMYQK